jgi:biopolymer transport protein ExbD
MRREKDRYREEGAIRSDINVTPLVDVCLVLLIIFMVVTPLIGKGNVKLPETRDPKAMPEQKGQLTVSIQEDGALSLGAERLTGAAGLAAALREAYGRSPEQLVVVKGDRRLTYREVHQVLRRVKEAGFTHAGLAADKWKD